MLQGFLDPILQQHVIGHDEMIVGIQRGVMSQDVHQLVVVLVDLRIEDLSRLAHGMDACVHQRPVLPMPIPVSLFRIDAQQC